MDHNRFRVAVRKSCAWRSNSWLRWIADAMFSPVSGNPLIRSKSSPSRVTSATAFSSLISASGRCDSIARR